MTAFLITIRYIQWNTTLRYHLSHQLFVVLHLPKPSCYKVYYIFQNTHISTLSWHFLMHDLPLCLQQELHAGCLSIQSTWIHLPVLVGFVLYESRVWRYLRGNQKFVKNVETLYYNYIFIWKCLEFKLKTTACNIQSRAEQIPKGSSESVYRSRTDNRMAIEKGQKDKQRSTKHTHKTKDLVTRTPLKLGVNPGAPEG